MKKRVDAVALLKLLKGGDSQFETHMDTRFDSHVDAFIGHHLEGGFVKNKDEMFRKAAAIMIHSLYPPAIMHWMRVFGKDSGRYSTYIHSYTRTNLLHSYIKTSTRTYINTLHSACSTFRESSSE